MSLAAFQKIDHQVASDSVQPSAEGSFGFIRLPAFQSSGHSDQDFLSNVQGVGVLKAFALSQPKDQRLVDLRELAPGIQI